MRSRKLAASDVASRSVDWIPPDERFGEAHDLINVQFVRNLNLTAMATRVVALSVGAIYSGPLPQSCLPHCLGRYLWRFTRRKGPQLGSRRLSSHGRSFGYVGAALTGLVFSLIKYVQ
jgi:nucleobase:cation symporter-1, NCS1 family